MNRQEMMIQLLVKFKEDINEMIQLYDYTDIEIELDDENQKVIKVGVHKDTNVDIRIFVNTQGQVRFNIIKDSDGLTYVDSQISLDTVVYDLNFTILKGLIEFFEE